MTALSRKRVAILISGRGSNMSALIAAAMNPSYPAEIVGVVSNKGDAKGLETAKRYHIPTITIDQKAYENRSSHEQAMVAALDEMRPDILCLAGYMRLLSPRFVERYLGRMINIHPSLLPLFPGLDTHQKVLDAGMRVHGCTVHFVTVEMDQGPIIAQAAIAVEPGDTVETLSERLLRAEHRLYPHALQLVLSEAVRFADNRAVIGHEQMMADIEPVRIADGPPILISPDARRASQ